jgi:hypothetical protein
MSIVVEGTMATDDEVGLLEEQYAWKREKQKTEHYGTRPGSTVARLTSIVSFICPFVAFFLGIAIGTYWTGRLDDLCLERTSITCEWKTADSLYRRYL